MAKKRGLGIPKIKCPNCRESFSISKGFNIHQAKAHLNDSRKYRSKDTAGDWIYHGLHKSW